MWPNRKRRGRPWFLIHANEQRTNNGKSIFRYPASWIDCSTIRHHDNGERGQLVKWRFVYRWHIVINLLFAAKKAQNSNY